MDTMEKKPDMSSDDEFIANISSNLQWIESIRTFITDPYLTQLVKWNRINEIHNTFKRRFFKRVKVKSEHVGVWGWNSWCGIHLLPLLIGEKYINLIKNTIETGFQYTEKGTGVLPHAIIHKDGIFASEPTYRCYDGVHGEDYNIDNILCWAKMAMEYFLISSDFEWFLGIATGSKSDKLKIIETTINFFLNNRRDKYNPKLIYSGIEGDWTECTDWELDNSNVNANMIKTLELLIESLKLIKIEHNSSNNDEATGAITDADTDADTSIEDKIEKYNLIRNELIDEFNKDVSEGGFLNDDKGFYIHGNDGIGENIHGDRYFESTVNYFSILWNIADDYKRKRILDYIDKNSDKIERPYPVLTNYKPRTGARRKDYGKTVTNGDIWLVLGGHATAVRIQNGKSRINGLNKTDKGGEMFKMIVDYRLEHGVFHNSIYLNGTTNDVWDPEVANSGAAFPPLLLGILGIKLTAESVKFNIKPILGLEYFNIDLFMFGRKFRLQIQWNAVNIVSNAGNKEGKQEQQSSLPEFKKAKILEYKHYKHGSEESTFIKSTKTNPDTIISELILLEEFLTPSFSIKRL